MADQDVLDLETTIKALPGVLGCVILTDTEGRPAEIQAFSRVGSDQDEIQRLIVDEVAERGLSGPLRRVFVFELDAEPHFGDRESLERAAELAEQEARSRGFIEMTGANPGSVEAPPTFTPPLDRRPPLREVTLKSSAWRSQAEVAIGSEGRETIGQAEGEKTTHGLKVLAQATLDAVGHLVSDTDFTLTGASLVTTFGREGVLVLVQEREYTETLGAALVREGPVAEAAVRATLDAVNRRLAQG